MKSPVSERRTTTKKVAAELMAHPLAREAARYLIVGGGSFLVDFSILAVLGLFGMHYLLAAAFGFLAGMSFNYVLSIRWVFDARSVRNPTHEAAVFVAIGLAGLAMNELLMWLLTTGGGLHPLFSKVIVTGIVLFWNYGARKFLLFREVDEPDSTTAKRSAAA